MIETLLQSGALAFEAVITVMIALIFQRLGRIEKDISALSLQSDDYHAKVDRLEGRFERMKH